jgi:hypothetical protein
MRRHCEKQRRPYNIWTYVRILLNGAFDATCDHPVGAKLNKLNNLHSQNADGTSANH